MAYHNLFCDSYQQYLDKLAPTIFPEYQLVTKDYLEEYFGIKFEGESETTDPQQCGSD